MLKYVFIVLFIFLFFVVEILVLKFVVNLEWFGLFVIRWIVFVWEFVLNNVFCGLGRIFICLMLVVKIFKFWLVIEIGILLR